MTEDELQKLVLEAVKVRSLIAYHTYDSRRSQPGFPDLVIVGQNAALFRELKSAKGRVTPEQKFWIAALDQAGMDVDIWRPADWPIRIMAELAQLDRVTLERPLPSQAEVRRYLQRHNRG